MLTSSRLALAVALAAMLVPASSAAAAPVRGTFVAALDDRPALNLALVTDGRRVVAYVCDNGRRSAWFDGRFRGVVATLRARGRRGSISLRSRGAALAGVVRLAGRTLRFRALRARGRAGLWRASVTGQESTAVEATWIVLRNGTQTGAIVDGTNIDRPPVLDTAQPDVQLADQDLTADEIAPIDLFPFAVSPQVVTITPPSGTPRQGVPAISIIRDGIADVTGVVVRIDGQIAQLGRRDPANDRISVGLSGAAAGSGTHDVSVKLPGQAELVRRNAFRVVISRPGP